MKKELGRYILDGHQPVPCEDTRAWGGWMEHADRCVALTAQEDVWVSTVFLGLDHSFHFDGPPLLFETMAFDSSGDGVDMTRCSTWEEAEAGHAEMVRKVFSQRCQKT